jgi:hypothetical protein
MLFGGNYSKKRGDKKGKYDIKTKKEKKQREHLS